MRRLTSFRSRALGHALNSRDATPSFLCRCPRPPDPVRLHCATRKIPGLDTPSRLGATPAAVDFLSWDWAAPRAPSHPSYQPLFRLYYDAPTLRLHRRPSPLAPPSWQRSVRFRSLRLFLRGHKKHVESCREL
jgi:hypothetical protein